MLWAAYIAPSGQLWMWSSYQRNANSYQCIDKETEIESKTKKKRGSNCKPKSQTPKTKWRKQSTVAKMPENARQALSSLKHSNQSNTAALEATRAWQTQKKEIVRKSIVERTRPKEILGVFCKNLGRVVSFLKYLL